MPCFISMAAIYTYMYTYISDSVSNHSFPSPIEFFENPQKAMFFVSFFFTVSFFSLLILSFFLYKKQRKTKENQNTRNPNQSDPEEFESSLAKITQETLKADPTHLTNSLLLEILHSDSPKWAGLLGNKCEDPESNGSGEGGKRKKKRARKKRLGLGGEENHGKEENLGLESGCRVKPELVCLYPFTSSTSATQRKIKQQYDQLVKCNESNGLTLAEVGHFANCLIEAKKELQHKSEVIQRKFTITKALLFKADRSSLDRLRQQIYKLEIEQKRLEEDSAVYNWLQHQLKLSPAYKKMLEINDSMELKAKSDNLMESTDTEFAEISFEELLAQEKKDSFWQRNGKSRSCSS